MRVLLLPVGDLPNGLLPRLSDRLARLGIAAEILEPIPVTRSRTTTGPLRAETLVRIAAERGSAVLAVTSEDLCAEGFEFVFGYANIGSSGAVVSMARLRDGKPGRLLDRVVKEAVHELGHNWGLVHCDTPGCVMRHSDSVEDADTREERFCEDCQTRIGFGIGRR